MTQCDVRKRSSTTILKDILTDVNSYHNASKTLINQILTNLRKLSFTRAAIDFNTSYTVYVSGYRTCTCNLVNIKGRTNCAPKLLSIPLLQLLPKNSFSCTCTTNIQGRQYKDEGYFAINDNDRTVSYVIDVPLMIVLDVNLSVRIPKTLLKKYPHIMSLPQGTLEQVLDIDVHIIDRTFRIPYTMRCEYSVRNQSKGWYWVIEIYGTPNAERERQ